MKKFTITIKLFCKTLSVIIPYVLLMLCINIALFQLTSAFATAAKDPDQLSDALYFFGDINFVCFFLYMFFLFIGYEFMRKVRGARMEEILSSYGGAGMKIYLKQFFVLALAVVLASANVSVYAVWGWKNLACADELLGEVVRLLLVNVFLLSLAAISMGTILSKIRNRFAGYAVIVLILFLILPNTVTFYESLQMEYHIPIFFIRDLIFLIPPDMIVSPDALYGFPLENYRIAGMLLWVAAAAAVLIWNILRKQVRLRNAVTVGLFLLMGFFIYETESKGSVLLMWHHPESASEVSAYYGNHEGKSEEAAFGVSKYELELKMGKELEAEVWMTLSAEESPAEYHFTLDHAYRVRNVTDQDGAPLTYSRDGDYISVEAGGRKLSQIGISYKGHSTLFYANKKACFLPGFFAYYPKAGYQTAYSEGALSYLHHKEPKTQFEVTIDRDSMTSNLPKTDSGFQGEAEALTLVDGYYRITQEGDYRILSYPLMESEDESNRELPVQLVAEFEELKEYLGIDSEDLRLDLPDNVFIVPGGLAFNSNVRSLYLYEDHAVISPTTSDKDILSYKLRQKLTPEKETFHEAFFGVFLAAYDMIDSDETSEQETLWLWRYADDSSFSGYETEEAELHDICIDKMKELGIRNFFQLAIHYMLDGDDHTDPFTFLNSMKFHLN